jgi:hypothetical protein
MSHRAGTLALEELLRTPALEETGPVLADGRSGRCYWLIPLGSFPTCKAMPPDVSLLLPGQGVEMPDPDPDPEGDPWFERDVTQSVTWAHWPATNGTLTSPRRLVGLLTGLRQSRTPSRCSAATIRRPRTCLRRSLHSQSPSREDPPSAEAAD